MERPLLSEFKFRQSTIFPKENEYYFDDGSIFYIEPIFYTQLEGVINIHHDALRDIINEMTRLVKRNLKVIFVGDFEAPYLKSDEFIYVEMIDILDSLKIYIEDKSRGSDYGD